MTVREPGWIVDALLTCPIEGVEVVRLSGELQDLPAATPMPEFERRYLAMLEARDRLYQAWITLQLDEPEAPAA